MIVKVLWFVTIALFYHVGIYPIIRKTDFRMETFNRLQQFFCCELDIELPGGFCRREFFPESGKDLFKIGVRHT